MNADDRRENVSPGKCEMFPYQEKYEKLSRWKER
jgi:hypothetical protein